MSLLFTGVIGLLQPYLESYMTEVIIDMGLDLTQNIKEKRIIKKEKEKTMTLLYDLLEQNEDNSLLTSAEFYDFFKNYAKNIIIDLLEIDSSNNHTKSKDKQIAELMSLYSQQFHRFSPYDKSRGSDFIKKFFGICYKFKRNLYKALLRGNTKQILEYELNEDMLIKICENIENMYDSFQKYFNELEIKDTVSPQAIEKNSSLISKKTVKSFSDSFVSPLIFEDANDAKSLKDVFIWPDYKMELLVKEQTDLQQIIENFLKGSLRKYLYKKGIDKLKIDIGYNILVILGMGGMGKSSLLEKLAYDILNCNITINTGNIFFAKLSKIGSESNDLLENILFYLNIKKSNLENSILILDAFDEYITNDINKQEIVENFSHEVELLNCKTIITSRENYFDSSHLGNCLSIKLLTFNATKRMEWLEKYNRLLSHKVKEDIYNYYDENDQAGEEFIGIPIIIYMIAANNIIISNYETKFEFYNSLFGEKGIWYKRIYDINHPALSRKYKEMLIFILDISKQMFLKNKNSIGLIEIDNVIKKSVSKKDTEYIKNWFGIVTYFRKNKLKEIEFAHKSILEYYTAFAIYKMVLKVINENNHTLKIKNVEQFFYMQNISNEILYFYDGFIEKQVAEIDMGSLIITLKLVINIDLLITEYSTFKNLNNIYNFFCNIFNCLLKIIEKKLGKSLIDFLDKDDINNLLFFFKNKTYSYIFMKRLNLSNNVLRRVHFNNADLTKSNMKNCDFSFCDFSNAILTGCNLANSNLFCATLSGANLCFADLRGSNLSKWIIRKEKKYFIGTKIYITQIKHFWPEIVSFWRYFEIYVDDNCLASGDDILFEINKIRGFHL